MEKIETLLSSSLRKRIFIYVVQNPGKTVNEIAEALGNKGPSISRAITQLDGLLRFKPTTGKRDKRAKAVYATLKPIYQSLYEYFGKKIDDLKVEVYDAFFLKPKPAEYILKEIDVGGNIVFALLDSFKALKTEKRTPEFKRCSRLFQRDLYRGFKKLLGV